MNRRFFTMPPANAPWRLEYGALPLPDGATEFRVWAPRAGKVELVFPGQEGRVVRLDEAGEGVHGARVPEVPPGSDYAYRLDGGPPLPDPVSRWQPAGVHGPSRVVDPTEYSWSDGAWRGMPLAEQVTYELHVGTFSPEGTFAGVVERLDYLRDLGVTAVELMPVAQFPGTRNWGYDGAHPYAPQHGYGGPAGLRALVDACHARGLAVLLDVVYNHLGPEGNYLGRYGPYFSHRYHTPWGEALNFDDRDCEPVRRYFIENALYWLTEYHLDGLRLDAVHGIFDFGARHVLAELSEAFHSQARRLDRTAVLVAESDLNDTRVIDDREHGGWGLDAQWSDDFHHAQHALLTGARHGYFVDFGRVSHLAKALEQGFVNDGGWSAYRRRRHGNSSAGHPGEQFVIAVQNHDQVANACHGVRLGVLGGPEREKLAAALLLCAPNVPMLFMGQEYGAVTPFHFFTSHGDAGLARSVTEGRRAEMHALQGGAEFMDPQDEATFAACRLDWDCLERAPHAGVLSFYRALLSTRRAQPCLCKLDKTHTRAIADDEAGWLLLRRGTAELDKRGAALLVANCCDGTTRVPAEDLRRGLGDGNAGNAEWTLSLWSGDPAYGGSGAPLPADRLADSGPVPALMLGPWQAALYLLSEVPR